MVLHTATCHTVTHYRKNTGKDGFTGGAYIKVCSYEPSPLLVWMATYGAKNFNSICSHCNPDISSMGQATDEAAIESARLEAEARRLMASPAKLKQQLAEIPYEPATYRYAPTKVFNRSPAVVAAVLLRANGVCENCHLNTPFLRASNNEPYLEVHHKVLPSEGGADHPENALALCPNCHREAHFG